MRSGTKAQPRATASGAPKIRPRASKPAGWEDRATAVGGGYAGMASSSRSGSAVARGAVGTASQASGGRTCHHIHLLSLVPLHQQVNGVLEGGGVQEDGGHILELDAGLQRRKAGGGRAETGQGQAHAAEWVGILRPCCASSIVRNQQQAATPVNMAARAAQPLGPAGSSKQPQQTVAASPWGSRG